MFLKNKIHLSVVILSLTSCSSVEVNESFMEDYGIVCPMLDKKTERKLTKEMKKISIGGKDCVKVKIDKDPSRDYYLREWEKGRLPEMPDLP